ncbi:hypothetical protein BDZ97DRAFT_367163 [Flammula alnicola]|nr:hypothetical protein BDZ97DRAFT_367163 [Flammula alnicola]
MVEFLDYTPPDPKSLCQIFRPRNFRTLSSVTERPASRFLFLRFSHGRPPTVSIFTRTPEISSDSHYTVCAAIIQAGEIPSSHRDLHSSCESLGRLIYKACRRFLLDPSLSGSFVPYVLAPLSRIGLPPLGSCDIHLPSGCYNNLILPTPTTQEDGRQTCGYL